MNAPAQYGESRFPVLFLYITAFICVLPFGLNLAGIDFGSEVHGFHVEEIASWGISGAALADEMFYTLTGALEHGLLEWSAVSVAALTILLAFSHFATNKDVTTPIIGIALFCSGAMDAFHTLAAMRLTDAVADNSSVIPFTWALSRTFNAAILIVGVLICLRLKVTSTRTSMTTILTVGFFFVGLAYFLITYTASNENLPVTQYPDAFIKRPYDVAPLVLFILAAPIFWKLYRQNSNLLTASLIIALVPGIVLEAHMAFGSSTLFDNHFNIAHFLKIVAYFVPFMGLVLDYIGTHKKLTFVIDDLKVSNEKIKRISADLVESQRRAFAIVSNAADGIITIDQQGLIDQFNTAAERIFGYKEDEVLGKNVKMLMPEPHRSEHDGYLANYLKTRNSNIIGVERELSGLKKDGTQFPLTIAVSEIQIENHTLFTGIVRDITEQKKMEKERVDLIASLRETNDELEEFAYRTSHDLKAPLVNIRGLSNIMKEDLNDGDYEEVFTNIDKLGSLSLKLEHLVEDIVEVAKIDHANDAIEEVDVAEEVNLIKESLDTFIQEKQVDVRVVIESAKPIRVQKSILQGVLENLMSNAVKYSDPEKPERFVKVTVSESNGGARIQISDNGLGIPQEYHGQMFGMFKRFHKQSSFGSGLGLYLVKKNLGKIKGTIGFESSPEGTVFTIDLPFANRNAAKHSC